MAIAFGKFAIEKIGKPALRFRIQSSRLSFQRVASERRRKGWQALQRTVIEFPVRSVREGSVAFAGML
jgi:hypothetical protein